MQPAGVRDIGALRSRAAIGVSGICLMYPEH